MLSLRSFFCNFFSFFILLFHLGCFTFSSHHHHHHYRRRRRDCSSSLFKKKLAPQKTTLFSFLRNLFSSSSSSRPISQPVAPSIPSPSSSTRSLRLNPPVIVRLAPAEEIINHANVFPGADIFPCSVCGEIFQTSTLLEQHQSTKHAVSELVDGENIVRIIFKMGWPDKTKSPTIHRILKIHNSPKIVARFEEYRECVKSRAAAKIKTLRDERCIADGNELLRFYCTTFICGPGFQHLQPAILQRLRDYQERILAQDGRNLHAANELEGTRRHPGGPGGGIQLHARKTGPSRLSGHCRPGRLRPWSSRQGGSGFRFFGGSSGQWRVRG
ncbi:UNVERIFIED_CONTAM: hypothetical protein Slati_2866700 [Sesamum latifolium]|uniref:C2H2-type domain-containing protein n=1 Tax=Sesamum latifolium TaxID=2727402 RepID=A0AAW2VBN5_9LAMI